NVTAEQCTYGPRIFIPKAHIAVGVEEPAADAGVVFLVGPVGIGPDASPGFGRSRQTSGVRVQDIAVLGLAHAAILGRIERLSKLPQEYVDILPPDQGILVASRGV